MTRPHPLFRLEDYRPTPYHIPRTRLTFQLEEKARIHAQLHIERREGTQAATPLVLDGDELELISLKINDVPLAEGSYRVTPDRLEIISPPEHPFQLDIITQVHPAKNKKLMGLYRSNGVFCTQCEAQGFRRITYFYDRPDVLSVFSVRIEADSSTCPVLLSNGDPKGSGLLDNNRHFALWHDPFPKPSYLFALVAGDLEALHDQYVTTHGKHVDLAIYVEKGKAPRAAYALDSLKRSMRWDEENFGCEYDLSVFNIVAVSDFNMGAMENKGLNIFNDRYILADETSETDSDFANVERVVAHEYFHNWTGNRITCRDWFQLCLKEGLTVYRDQEFSGDQRSKAVSRIEDVRLLQATQFVEDAGPLAHPVRPRQYSEINNFYTTTIYEKGAELVRMIATWLGSELFRAGMDLYLHRHDGQACTVEDFIACFAEVSAQDFSQFMLWYEQAGTPHIRGSFDYDEKKEVFRLTLEQHIKPTPGQQQKQPMLIPIRFALLGEDGKEMAYQASGAVRDDILLLDQENQTFCFSGLKSRPIPSLLRGFSAPVVLELPLETKELAFLARHDSDGVNRWLSLNRLLLEELARNAQNPKQDEKTQGKGNRPLLIQLLKEIASDAKLDPAFRAMALTLPSENEIAYAMNSDVDPDRVLAAREGLRMEVARAGYQDFAKLREGFQPKRPYSPDAQEAGKRALSNMLLDYLSIDEKNPALALRFYERADNMTDRSSALRILCQHFGQTQACLDSLQDFERRFSHDPLVMDKWFAVQAAIPGAEALDRIRKLIRHPLFSEDNPNRVRALIGTFASTNQTGFNRADGKAYQFFAEFIIKIDANNPQLAARLLTILRSWRILEEKRRNKIEMALQTIAATQTLSTDMRDIVNRMLGQIL